MGIGITTVDEDDKPVQPMLNKKVRATKQRKPFQVIYIPVETKAKLNQLRLRKKEFYYDIIERLLKYRNWDIVNNAFIWLDGSTIQTEVKKDDKVLNTSVEEI